MAQKLAKSAKIVNNKFTKFAQQKLPKIVQNQPIFPTNGPILLTIDQSWPNFSQNWSKSAKLQPKSPSIGQNEQKNLPKLANINQIYPKLAKIAQNCPKLPKTLALIAPK